MSNNHAIQFLRASTTPPSSIDTAQNKLKAGQPFFNKTTRELKVGTSDNQHI